VLLRGREDIGNTSSSVEVHPSWESSKDRMRSRFQWIRNVAYQPRTKNPRYILSSSVMGIIGSYLVFAVNSWDRGMSPLEGRVRKEI